MSVIGSIKSKKYLLSAYHIPDPKLGTTERAVPPGSQCLVHGSLNLIQSGW